MLLEDDSVGAQDIPPVCATEHGVGIRLSRDGFGGRRASGGRPGQRAGDGSKTAGGGMHSRGDCRRPHERPGQGLCSSHDKDRPGSRRERPRVPAKSTAISTSAKASSGLAVWFAKRGGRCVSKAQRASVVRRPASAPTHCALRGRDTTERRSPPAPCEGRPSLP